MCVFLEAILKMTNIAECNPDDLSCELRLHVSQNPENLSPTSLPIRFPCNLASCNNATRNTNPTCRVVAWAACNSSSQDAKYGSREYSSSSRFLPFLVTSSRERKWLPAYCCIPHHVTIIEGFPRYVHTYFAHITVQAKLSKKNNNIRQFVWRCRRCTSPWRYLLWYFICQCSHTRSFRDVNLEKLSGVSVFPLAADFFPIISVIISVRSPVT